MVKYEMQLNLQNNIPFHCPPRRLSYFEKTELQKLLDEYLAKGFIKPSSSEYASAIVLVKKKTGGLRMCVDYRILNKIVLKDNYPLPLIEDLIDKLVDKKYFSSLDLKDGFFHVYMHENSKKYTSFVTPLGQFEWQRMPFGLKNGPSVFQRFVNTIFADMVVKGEVIVYMDDVLVATDNLENHLKILKKVFGKMVENKLELRLDKCKFLQNKIQYLGYVVTEKGIQPNDKGIDAIKNFPLPSNAHDVQRFLGLGSYFRKFINNFSLVAKPLYDLIRKNNTFNFGIQELESFEAIKEKLIKAPILAIYNPNDETELHCDASSNGFGAILLQKKNDAKLHPIFYFSKRTTEVESKYHSFELETLAIIYAIRRFRIYLQGIKFKIITDCSALTLTLSKKDLNPRIARWALELQNFDYVLEHRSGSKMHHVDSLSRVSNILMLETNSFEENLIICQGKDDNIKNIRKILEKSEHPLYELRNGIVYKKINKEEILFYVPQDMVTHVIYKYHDEIGHVGVNKTIELIKNSYWFPKMKKKVEVHLANCLKCIAFSHKHGRSEGFLHNIPKSTLPFETLHIDHFGPVENAGRAKKHILVVIDSSTKFVRLYSTKTTNTKEVILAMKDYFKSYSRPKTIISDRGSSFTSQEFEQFLIKNNIQHIKIATGSPQANGQVERVNRSLGPMIAKLTEPEKGLFWDKILENVEFALNNTFHRSIGGYPSVLLFGVKQKGTVVDTLRENHMEEIQKPERRNLQLTRDNARKKEEKLQQYNKMYVDKNRQKPKLFKEGDYVMVKNFDSHTNGPKKLIPKFKGPYEIAKILKNDRYVLKDVENLQQTQIPYKGVWAIANMRPWFRNRNG